MDDSLPSRLLILLLLLVLSAFFAACEAAFFSLNQAQLAEFKARRGRIGALIHSLLERPKELLITIYIGNELVNIAISALTTSIAMHLFGNAGLAVAIGVGTFLILLFGEVVPKSLSLAFSEKFVFLSARLLDWFFRLVHPIQSRLTQLAESMLGIIGIDTQNERSKGAISNMEFSTMVALGEGHGVIEAQERKMIQNVMQFGNKMVQEVMTPEIDMFTLQCDEKMDEILPKIIENFYSRVPVYEKDGETIAGILFTKDLNRFKQIPPEKFNLKSMLQPAIFVPETKRLNEMMEEFKRLKRHMAIVLDEYGRIVGLITLEDIIEELVGEIDSEMRAEELPLAKLGGNRYRLSGTYPISDFNSEFNCILPNGEVNTIGGFVFGLFGRVPRSGESVLHDNFRFVVERMKGARILNLQLTVLERASSTSDAEAN